MKTLGVGILGFGFMGKTHTYGYKTIPIAYDPPPVRCELKVVCRTTEEGGRAAMEAGGFERCTTDPMAVIEAADVDVVHVCTPNTEHFAALQAAVRAGKHIYCDKPVVASLEEADELAPMLAGYDGVGQVALQYRFLPATLKAKELADDGFIGPISHFRAAYLHAGSVDPARAVNWKSTAAAGGGVIRDLGSHVLDLVNWLIGPFEAVRCISRIWSPERPNKDRPGEMITVDVEEAAIMTIRMPDGAFGTVEASKIATGTEDELRFEIHGLYGAMRFNLMQPNYLEVYDGRLEDGDLGGRRGWQQIACVQKYPGPGGTFPGGKLSVGWIRSHVHCLYSFLKSIADGTPAHPSLAEGLHLQRMLEAARRAAETGGWEDLPLIV